MIPAPAGTIDEAIQTMTQLQDSLDDADGVASFNRLYLNVTQEVRLQLGESAFENVEFLDALDVSFANFYFEAFARVETGAPCPIAWEPLFSHRYKPNTARLQFALAGMNAHINHDLPLAVVGTATARSIDPFGDSPYQRDFFRVNDLLAHVEEKIKVWFAVGAIAELDDHLGRVDDALSMWCIHAARRAAWDAAAFLWNVRGHQQISKEYEQVLARLVNLAGRAVLV